MAKPSTFRLAIPEDVGQRNYAVKVQKIWVLLSNRESFHEKAIHSVTTAFENHS